MRVVIVTGAGRGQGLAITRRLVADGYAVVATDREARGVEVATEAGATAVRTEVTDPQGWAAAVDAAVGLGQLWGLVNNAGVLKRTPIAEEDVEGFRSIWEANCLGPFLGIQAVLPHLLAAGAGSIVNTCSTAAITGFPLHAAYSSSKFALRGLTQSVAAELLGTGVRMNAVFPGVVETPMLSPETLARLRGDGKAIGQPEDIAELIAFLISDAARFVHGAEHVIDGGELRR